MHLQPNIPKIVDVSPNVPSLSAVASLDYDDTTPVVAVLLHGYGSNERDLAGLADALGLGLPWVSLRGPIDANGGGAAWFPIIRPGDPESEPVEQATESIWAWVDEHLAAGVQVIPVGFSQGGLMATQLLRTRPERVIAPVLLGGFVMGVPQPGDVQLQAQKPRLFWGRGADDRVITGQAVARTDSWLPRHTTLERRVYSGLSHAVSAEELADARSFVLDAIAAAA